jgi:transcriptional regulator with XRE-family HTH domain
VPFYGSRRLVSAKPLGITTESFGRRIAKLRADSGWTQTELAERVGLSRVGLSHVEATMSVPSERTVILLAGVFLMEPHQLVADTDYPPAKAERLPAVAARYTEVDHQLRTLDAVLDTLDRAAAARDRDRLLDEIRGEWRSRLGDLLDRTVDNDERARIRAVLQSLAGHSLP